MTIAIAPKGQELGCHICYQGVLAVACWFLLPPPVLIVHDFSTFWATASSCLLPAFGFHAKLFVFINFSLQSLKQNFYHPFMDSVFFLLCVNFPLHSFAVLFVFLPFGHYLKVCGPTHLRLVAGRGSATTI